MEQIPKLIDPNGGIKSADSIGHFYEGAFESIMSSGASRVYVASCWKDSDSKQYLSIWNTKPNDIRKFVTDKVSENMDLSDISTELLRKYKLDNYTSDGPEYDGIPPRLLDSIGKYSDNELLSNIIEKKCTGFGLIYEYDKSDILSGYDRMVQYVENDGKSEEDNKKYQPSFTNDMIKLNIAFENSIEYKVYINGSPIEYPKLSYIDDHTFDIPIHINENITDSDVVIEYNDNIIEIPSCESSRRKLCVNKHPLKHYQEEGYNTEVILKLSLTNSKHYNDLKDTYNMDFKCLRSPIISSNGKLHGIGNNVKLPTAFTKRSAFGSLEALTLQQVIVITPNLNTKFGITSQKDRVDLENPPSVVRTILEKICLKIFGTICKTIGTKGKTPYDIILDQFINKRKGFPLDKPLSEDDQIYQKIFSDIIEFSITSSKRTSALDLCNKIGSIHEHNLKYLTSQVPVDDAPESSVDDAPESSVDDESESSVDDAPESSVDDESEASVDSSSSNHIISITPIESTRGPSFTQQITTKEFRDQLKNDDSKFNKKIHQSDRTEIVKALICSLSYRELVQILIELQIGNDEGNYAKLGAQFVRLTEPYFN